LGALETRPLDNQGSAFETRPLLVAYRARTLDEPC
jgi:hypothetical protein